MTGLLSEASLLALRDQIMSTEKAATTAESIARGTSESLQRSLFSANNQPFSHLPLLPEDQLMCIEKDVSQVESQLRRIREICARTADGYYMRPVEVDQLIEGLNSIRQRISELKDHLETGDQSLGSRQQRRLSAAGAAAADFDEEACGGGSDSRPNGREGFDDSSSRAMSPPIPLNASASVAAAPPSQPPVPLMDQMQLGHQLLGLPPFLVGPGFGSLDLMSAFSGAGYGVDMLKMLQQQVRDTSAADALVMTPASGGAPAVSASHANRRSGHEKEKQQQQPQQQQQQQQQLQFQHQQQLSPQLPPLDTSQIAAEVRGLLSRYNIGQRLFAKQVLGLSQGTVSELLSKPKPWDKLTEKGRESYRKMSIWAASESSVHALKAMAPVKRGLPASDADHQESLPLKLDDVAGSGGGHASAGAAASKYDKQLSSAAAAASLTAAASAAAIQFDSDASRSSSRSEELGGKLVMDAPLPYQQQHQQQHQQHQPLLLPPADGGSAGTTRDIVRGIYQDQLRKAIAQASADGDNDTAARLAMEMHALETDRDREDDEDGDIGAELDMQRQQHVSQLYPHLPPPLSLGAEPPHHTASGGSAGLSSLKQSKLRLPQITKQQVEKYWELNTDDLVREVKELLNQFSISQRLFGEQVLGLSQGSVSDLLARPKPWSMLTQKGREPFIRMRIFVDDPTAVTRLVASNQSPLGRQTQSALQLHQQTPPPTPAPPPTQPLPPLQQQQLPDLIGSSVISTICANAASYLPDATIAQLAKSISVEIDTGLICQSVLEIMGNYQLTCQQLGSTVLGLSEARTAELLHSPVPWQELSAKEREPYLRLKLWLANPENPIRMHQSQQPAAENRGIKRGLPPAASAPANDASDAASSGESLLGAGGGGGSGKKTRYMFTEAQKEVLQEVFSREPYPSYSTVEQLAGEFQLPVKTVSNWFHNHRMRNKAVAAAAAAAVAVAGGDGGSPMSEGLDLRTTTAAVEEDLMPDEAPEANPPPPPPPQQLQQQQQQQHQSTSSRRKASKPVRVLATSQDGAAAAAAVAADDASSAGAD